MNPRWIPVEMRRQLPPFNAGEKLSANPTIQSYRQYYQLDLEQQLPHIDASIGVCAVGGFDIVVHSWVPTAAKGCVLVVHGYYDHVGLYVHLFKALLRAGFAVISFDLPGHGLSSGARVSIASFSQYQAVLKAIIPFAQSLPGPLAAIGQSTGGAILLDYVTAMGESGGSQPLEKLVLLAPLVRPANWHRSQWLHRLVSPFVRTIPRQFSASSNDEHFVRFVREEDPLQSRRLAALWVGALRRWVPAIERRAPVILPALVIQGQSDMTVDWRYNMKVVERLLPAADIVYLHKVRHHVVNELELYRRDIFARAIRFLSD